MVDETKATPEYVRIKEVRPGAIGRLWDIILEDGRHLAGWFSVRVVGDVHEVTRVSIDFRGHNATIDPVAIDEAPPVMGEPAPDQGSIVIDSVPGPVVRDGFVRHPTPSDP